jgi:hypothetical protein
VRLALAAACSAAAVLLGHGQQQQQQQQQQQPSGSGDGGGGTSSSSPPPPPSNAKRANIDDGAHGVSSMTGSRGRGSALCLQQRGVCGACAGSAARHVLGACSDAGRRALSCLGEPALAARKGCGTCSTCRAAPPQLQVCCVVSVAQHSVVAVCLLAWACGGRLDAALPRVRPHQPRRAVRGPHARPPAGRAKHSTGRRRRRRAGTSCAAAVAAVPAPPQPALATAATELLAALASRLQLMRAVVVRVRAVV